MKEKILSALKTKFVGINDAILDGIASKASKNITTEEQVNTYVEGLTIQAVLDSYADSRVTGAVKTAIQNYEVKYGIKDGKEVKPQPTPPTPTPTPPTPEPTPSNLSPELVAFFKEMKVMNEKLFAEINGIKQKDVTTSRTAQLNEAIKNLSPVQKKAYQRIGISSMTDEEFGQMLNEVSEEVKQITAETIANSAISSKPFAKFATPQNGEATDSEVDALMALK